MVAVIAIICVEIVIILLFAPINVGVKGYFSFSRLNAGFDIKLFEITLARVRFEKDDGKICLKVNDKPFDGQKIKIKKQTMLNMAKYVFDGNLKINGKILGVLGDANPKACAMLYSVVSMLAKAINPKTILYADFEHERIDVDFAFELNICLIQAFEMAN